MASMPFVVSLLDMWAAWNIRGFMILSLSMQLLLANVSPLRRETSNRLVILMIWSTYLLADWVAIFAFGLIMNSKFKNNATPQEVDVGQDLLALWSAFLLIHLGGPDSITAYALEDNTLWLRHLVGLVVQILAFLNIFVKTLPDNKLRVPTILIAIAGSIKYGERTRALYLASVENLKESVLKSRLLNLNGRSMRPEGVAAQSNSDDSNDERRSIRKAFHYFQIFKGLICDMMPNQSQWLESRDSFLHQDPRTAFEIVKTDLRFFYEVFYTKILAAHSTRGVLIRILAFYNVFAALIIFCMLKKDAFHGVDVRITFSLLAGVIALDTASEIMLEGSNWTKLDNTYAGYLTITHGVVLFTVGMGMLCMAYLLSALCCCEVATKQWSESTGTLSLLAQGFEESHPRKGSML